MITRAIIKVFRSGQFIKLPLVNIHIFLFPRTFYIEREPNAGLGRLFILETLRIEQIGIDQNGY